MDQILSCPACRKRHTLPVESRSCRRCGLDFGDLLEIQKAEATLRAKAGAALRGGAYQDALEHAAEAWELKHDPVSAAVACLASWVQGDLETAASWREALLAERAKPKS